MNEKADNVKLDLDKSERDSYTLKWTGLFIHLVRFI